MNGHVGRRPGAHTQAVPSRRATGVAGAGLTRRAVAGSIAGGVLAATGGCSVPASAPVNGPRTWPATPAPRRLECHVDVLAAPSPIDRRVFGTNLEWFNEGGGLAGPDADLRLRLADLARQARMSVFRFPGGTLADYYHWRDGIGPLGQRPTRLHPTDPGTSDNLFGSPEFFALLRATGAEGLITLNVGTGTPREAAEWVAYANQPFHPGRAADGFPEPIGIKLWEVGNELYLPGNPGEVKITQTPEEYARNYLAYAEAIRAVDPGATVIAIGVARAHVGPGTPYPDWTERLLSVAAGKIDMIAVHNAYFPLLYNVRQPSVEAVYPALWAAPEAVDRSLKVLTELLRRYEGTRPIDIAVTEWGALFSLPALDPFWFDHVKTIGSGVYLARLMQVFLSHPRLKLANFFKFTDRSFMGWVAFDGRPKVPYWVFRLYAEATGDQRLPASIDAPTFDTPGIGEVAPETGVPDVTVLASRASADRRIFVNLVNRSLTRSHTVAVTLKGRPTPATGLLRSVSASEPTAHDGRDIPPEWPMRDEDDPYTTAAPGSIRVNGATVPTDRIVLRPFSIATLILTMEDSQR